MNKINMQAAKFGELVEFFIYDNIFQDINFDELMDELKRYATCDIQEIERDYGEGYSYWQAALKENQPTKPVKVWHITIRNNNFFRTKGETGFVGLRQQGNAIYGEKL